jgi:hypothetical protein
MAITISQKSQNRVFLTFRAHAVARAYQKALKDWANVSDQAILVLPIFQAARISISHAFSECCEFEAAISSTESEEDPP